MNINIPIKAERTFAVIVVMLICGTLLIITSNYDSDIDLMKQPKMFCGTLLIAVGVISFFLVPWKRTYRKITYK